MALKTAVPMCVALLVCTLVLWLAVRPKREESPRVGPTARNPVERADVGDEGWWSEVAVPHLRVTILSVRRVEGERLALTVHVVPSAELGQVTLDGRALLAAVGGAVLRKETGEPIRLAGQGTGELFTLKPDLRILPREGLEWQLVTPVPLAAEYWAPLQAENPRGLDGHVSVRYYLSSQVRCLGGEPAGYFSLPVLGWGLVECDF